MKKVWRVFLDDNTPIDICIACAICRDKLSKWCLDCVANTLPDLNFATIEQVWFFLLLCNKRRDCLFAIFDKHIIEDIF